MPNRTKNLCILAICLLAAACRSNARVEADLQRAGHALCHVPDSALRILEAYHLLSKIESIDGFTDTALIDLDDTHQLKIPVRCFWDAPSRLWCADPY